MTATRFDIAVGRRLENARNRLHKTAKLGARAAGAAYTTYAQHEAGQRGVSPEVAVQYAAAFGVTPEWLLFGRAGPTKAILSVAAQVDTSVFAGLKLHYAPSGEWHAEIECDYREGGQKVMAATGDTVEEATQRAVERWRDWVEDQARPSTANDA